MHGEGCRCGLPACRPGDPTPLPPRSPGPPCTQPCRRPPLAARHAACAASLRQPLALAAPGAAAGSQHHCEARLPACLVGCCAAAACSDRALAILTPQPCRAAVQRPAPPPALPAARAAAVPVPATGAADSCWAGAAAAHRPAGACPSQAGMHARGLRLVVRVDGGGRLGVALIRHGSPVPGISAGGGTSTMPKLLITRVAPADVFVCVCVPCQTLYCLNYGRQGRMGTHQAAMPRGRPLLLATNRRP